MTEEQEIVREFLIESNENLSHLDNQIVDLEQHANDPDLLASIFRTFHTIKGTCGFLGFKNLEEITHRTETVLSQLRAGERELTEEIVSSVLEVVDATRSILAAIEATGNEGPSGNQDLIRRLSVLAENSAIPAPAPEKSPAPTAATASNPPTNQHHASAADSAIRVDVGLLDKLMNLVGELVLARNQILQHSGQNDDSGLTTTSQRLNLITSELQEGVMKTRMQPIGVVWNKFPRVVRDMAHSLGKQIGLEMDGAETELDKTIIEAIKDPLTHLVRNSCDHGIERPETRAGAGKPAEGKIRLRSYHEGGQVNIEISDDGQGIDIPRLKRKAIEKLLLTSEQVARLQDREALNLIFHPGLSTAETVTNVSGRGVGMDVVKSKIERIGGVVDVSSRPGEGATVRIRIPLTLAIIPGLVVTSGNRRSHPRTGAGHGSRFVIPQASLVELIRLEGESAKQIEWIHGAPVCRRRGSLLPIAFLNQVLDVSSEDNHGVTNIVVLQADDRQFGLVVDGIGDTQEIVVKPLGKQLKAITVYAGATIMGDGNVALILDVARIGQRAAVLNNVSGQASDASAAQAAERDSSGHQRILLFRAGSFERLAVPLSLVTRLEEFPRSSIERAGGREVVQYREGILPLVPLASVLGGTADQSRAAGNQDPVQVIVFHDGGRSAGLVVDQILDVAEDSIEVGKHAGRKGLLGSGVIGGRVADLLDLNAVLEISGDPNFGGEQDV